MSSSAAVNSSSAGSSSAAVSSSSDHHPPCSSSPSSRLHPLTFWCHECEMSVSLLPSPSSPLLCPDCLRFDSLLPLDSPFPPSLIPFFPSHPSPDLSPANPTPESDSDSPRPLPAESIAAIPTVEIHDAAALCAICKDGLIPQGSPARCLPCSHLFHSDCIVPWLNLRNSCPLCRSSIPFLREPADRIDIHLEAPLRRMLASSTRMGMEETGSVETVTSEWRINGGWGGLEEAEVADAMYDVWEDVFA